MTGTRSISNALSIDDVPERIGPSTVDAARRLGLWDGRGPFSFRRTFGRPEMAFLAGARARRASTARALHAPGGGPVDLARVIRALRDHGGAEPWRGLRMASACAHASVYPTRHAGQTTASVVAALGPGGPRVWATGTSSPCLSVFKAIPMQRGGTVDFGVAPSLGRADDVSLFWRHERLHRAVMARPHAQALALFDDERAALEASAIADDATVEHATSSFTEHATRVATWAERVERSPVPRSQHPSERLSRWYWERESRREGLRHEGAR